MRPLIAVSFLLCLPGISRADVFNMGPGLTSLDLVTVGNVGNVNDATGYGKVDHVYQIGTYEVTASQYTEFLNAVAATDTHSLYDTNMWSFEWGCKIQRDGSSGSYTYSVAQERANRPVNCVSWGDAARFVNWLHNGQPTGTQSLATTEDGAYYLNGVMSNGALMAVTRNADARYWIPTENEWYKAAYHKNDGVTGNYFDYPTGSDNTPSNDLINPDPGNNANFEQNGYTIDSPYFFTEVGEFENSASPYGTFDQGGNVFEWNETATTTSYRGLRGGIWNCDSSYMLASYRSIGGTPFGGNSHHGFRVASVPEPGSFALFVCGVLASLLWWKQKRQ